MHVERRWTVTFVDERDAVRGRRSDRRVGKRTAFMERTVDCAGDRDMFREEEHQYLYLIELSRYQVRALRSLPYALRDLTICVGGFKGYETVFGNSQDRF